jgi:hypothetical protein
MRKNRRRELCSDAIRGQGDAGSALQAHEPPRRRRAALAGLQRRRATCPSRPAAVEAAMASRGLTAIWIIVSPMVSACLVNAATTLELVDEI